MKVVGFVVVAISIGSSVVAAPQTAGPLASTASASANSTATTSSASVDSNSEIERRKLGYAAVQILKNATATFHLHTL